MNLYQTKLGRKFLFASLYFSEGAPIGFIWLALPTRLRSSHVPIEQITWLAAILVLPWTLKFAWAPLLDLLRSSRWSLRHWVISCQTVMGLTLLPLLWIDPRTQFSLLAVTLLCHSFAAATQDVAIDALCISSTSPGERGEYNGWMQTGMMLGRASMGGGALVLAGYLGQQAVVWMLIALTTFSMSLVALSRPPASETKQFGRQHLLQLWSSLALALRSRNTWIGLAFAVIGGAAFKSLEVIYGPFLVDRGVSQELIGWFSLGPMIGAMIVGAIAGGLLTDRIGARKCALASLIYISAAIAVMALGDTGPVSGSSPSDAPDVESVPVNWFLLVCLTVTSFGIGVFTSASYALFMDISHPAIAATQFSAFMGATNGCESWSSAASGELIAAYGYPVSMLTMSAIAILAVPLLLLLNLGESGVQTDENSSLNPASGAANVSDSQ